MLRLANPFIGLDVSGPLRTVLCFFYSAQMKSLPLGSPQSFNLSFLPEVEGKFCGDVWQRAGRVTFVVNQPPAHPQLSLF